MRFAGLRDDYERRWSRVSNLRLGLFLLGVVVLGIGIAQQNLAWFVLLTLIIAGFTAAVSRHRSLGRAHRGYAELWQINHEGLVRQRRDWQNLPLRQPPNPPIGHHYANDLDLVGHASLQHLLNTAATPPGLATVQEWLLNPATTEAIARRQQAVEELAPAIDFRDELACRGRFMGTTGRDPEPFLRWAEEAPWLGQRPWLLWTTRLLPVATLVTLLAWAVGWIATPIWIAFVLGGLVIVLTISRHADEVIEQVSARQAVFQGYAEVFAHLTSTSFSSPELARLQQALTAGNLHADQQMRRLSRIMAFADFRMFMFYFPINVLTLWSLQSLALLERWQQVAGHQARAWLATLGEFEALAALAALRHDNPDWHFAEAQTAGRPQFDAAGLAHPLLPAAVRVANDVTIGPPGSFLLITGSNMSGKSTLLRSVGVNVVLAQMGAPVCAQRLALPPLRLATSMRVQDSLEQGVSYFMAELRRLKEVVDMAEATRAEGRATLMFLLDEILHGTNTAERQIAARQIIRHLIELGALGAVSTHDLGLAEDVIGSASQQVHFTEQFERGPDGPTMRFDYHLRPGLATSTNALKLMEIVGLPVDQLAD